MSIPLTPENKSLSKQINIEPQAILEIEGVPLVFGAQPVVEFTRWDSNVSWDQPGVNWDGLSTVDGSKDYIDLSGSTKSISQMILPDKGGSTSISSVNVKIVDKNNEVARALSFDTIGEILGKRANFYIGFKQAAFPESAIPVFRGVISDFYTQDGIVMVTVTHPEALKRQVLFQKYQSTLSGAINNSQTTINVVRTEELIPSSSNVVTCIRIDDEVMRVVSIDSATQITVERSYETTFAAPHDDESDIESIYILSGKPLELALKLMLSSETNDFFLSDDKPKSISGDILRFKSYDIKDITGLVNGDIIRLTGINAGDYIIKDFGKTDNDSFIQITQNLIDEVSFVGDFSYKSKYAVLSDGLGMFPFQVDVKQHEEIEAFNPSLFVDYKFYLKDTIDEPQDFISQIYFAQGLYSIPRNARASVKQVNPPLSVDIVPTINTKNITNITKIKQRRSLHKYLYNIYRYDYNEDILEDKTLNKKIIISQDSTDRIKGGRKQLKILAKGFRDNPPTDLNIQQISQRLVDRYRFAPTYFQGIDIKYTDGFNLEVGDVIPFGGGDTKVVDLQTGKRGQGEKLFEIVNKGLGIVDGKISVDLLETAFNIKARSAVISLSSIVDSGSTTTRIKLKLSYSVGEFTKETDKWINFEGKRIRVRNEDYIFDETVDFIGIDPSNSDFILVSALSIAPTDEMIIEVPEYDNSSDLIDSAYKLRFAYFNAAPVVTASIDNTSFDVDRPLDLSVGSEVYIHNETYTNDSFGSIFVINSISGNTVTLDKPLSFIPSVGDKIEFSDYLDGGFAYQII